MHVRPAPKTYHTDSIVILTCITVAFWRWSVSSSVTVKGIMFTAAINISVALVYWNWWRPKHFHREDWGQRHWLLGRVEWHWGNRPRSLFFRRKAPWWVRLLKPAISVWYNVLRWVWGIIFSASMVNCLCLGTYREAKRQNTLFFLQHTDKLKIQETLSSCIVT